MQTKKEGVELQLQERVRVRQKGVGRGEKGEGRREERRRKKGREEEGGRPVASWLLWEARENAEEDQQQGRKTEIEGCCHPLLRGVCVFVCV